MFVERFPTPLPNNFLSNALVTYEYLVNGDQDSFIKSL